MSTESATISSLVVALLIWSKICARIDVINKVFYEVDSMAPVNTIHQNQRMKHFDNHQTVWLFGYGSLIYKADFPYIERIPAQIHHWQRRFWQGSHDHRGTPENPGRVVTLIKKPGAICEGMAYRITPEEFDHLDHREKNGYLRLRVDIYLPDKHVVDGLIYIAAEDNSAFLGDAPLMHIAQQIAQSQGPSGPNSEYLLKLAEALRELGEVDEHVFQLEAAVRDLLNGHVLK